MKKELLINGGALNAPVFSALAAKQFLTENYSFRRNQLNGKVEFATKSSDGQASDYRPLTQEALNSIIRFQTPQAVVAISVCRYLRVSISTTQARLTTSSSMRRWSMN